MFVRKKWSPLFGEVDTVIGTKTRFSVEQITFFVVGTKNLNSLSGVTSQAVGLIKINKNEGMCFTNDNTKKPQHTKRRDES